VETSSSVEDACERYLDYGLSHPHEYELYYGAVLLLIMKTRPQHAADMRLICRASEATLLREASRK
jgi:hypothetical protein